MFSLLFSDSRQRWTSTQKEIMRKHFKVAIKTRKALRKHQCEEFLTKHQKNFADVGWLRIKTFIFNECNKT